MQIRRSFMKNMLKTMQDLLKEYYESFGMERGGK